LSDDTYEGPSHEDLKAVVNEFLEVTSDARSLSERCRDYYDGKQWTEAQIKELKRRKQAPIVNNRIKVKHNGLLGLTSLRKSDPKAFPRNQEHDSGAAEACTDGLRYAADKATLNNTLLQAANNYFCEGYCGVNVTVETNPKGEIDVIVDHIPWDRIFFDPYSRKNDFNDSRDKGYLMWMDEDDILDTFPDADETALSGEELQTDGTYDDKPVWFKKMGKRRRHLVATHYTRRKGKWCLSFYTGAGFLLKTMISSAVSCPSGVCDCPGPATSTRRLPLK
jgi:hypothetical protein